MIRKVFIWILAVSMVVDLIRDNCWLIVLEAKMKAARQQIEIEERKGSHD